MKLSLGKEPTVVHCTLLMLVIGATGAFLAVGTIVDDLIARESNPKTSPLEREFHCFGGFRPTYKYNEPGGWLLLSFHVSKKRQQRPRYHL